MKKLMIYTLLTAFMVGFMAFDADAQYRIRNKKKKKKKPKQDEYFDESRFSTQNLWYGAGGNLGFSSFNGNSAFNVGISPMVGYKIIEPISFGVRADIGYYYERINNFGSNIKYESISYGFGPFTRARVWNVFFHGEYTLRNIGTPYDEDNRGPFLDPNNDRKIETFRRSVNEFNIGLGYTSGDIIAYEIYILYNVLNDIDDFDDPWQIRFGMTYKF